MFWYSVFAAYFWVHGKGISIVLKSRKGSVLDPNDQLWTIIIMGVVLEDVDLF